VRDGKSNSAIMNYRTYFLILQEKELMRAREAIRRHLFLRKGKKTSIRQQKSSESGGD
jgi:hypothetical protein